MNESISYLSESDQEIIKKKEIFSKSIIMVKIMTKKIFISFNQILQIFMDVCNNFQIKQSLFKQTL